MGTVAPDCHVKSGKAFYSVPWRLMGQKVTVRAAGDVVQIFHADAVVATHVLHLSGRSTNFDHYPPHKIAHTLRTVTWCRTRAEQIGPGAVAIVAELSRSMPSTGCAPSRASSGYETRYGDHRLNAACARALAVGDPRYRTVKGILAAGTEARRRPPAGTSPAPPAMLRGPEAFDTERTAYPCQSSHSHSAATTSNQRNLS